MQVDRNGHTRALTHDSKPTYGQAHMYNTHAHFQKDTKDENIRDLLEKNIRLYSKTSDTHELFVTLLGHRVSAHNA